MAELIRRTGVPRATIHHYARAGLLPEPDRIASNRFLYDRRHERALRLIRLLRTQRNLSLDEIRGVLPDLLGVEDDEAFRRDLLDDAVGLHLARTGHRAPAQRLLDAAVEHFTRDGYGDTNVDDLCAAADIAKGSFYRHFASKEQLFYEVARRVTVGVVERFEPVRRGDGIDRDATAAALAGALEPGSPVAFELLTRALRGSDEHRSVVRQVIADTVATLADRLAAAGAGGATPLARTVLRRAVDRLVGGVLDPGADTAAGPSRGVDVGA